MCRIANAYTHDCRITNSAGRIDEDERIGGTMPPVPPPVPPNLQFGGCEYEHLKCEKNGLQILIFDTFGLQIRMDGMDGNGRKMTRKE